MRNCELGNEIDGFEEDDGDKKSDILMRNLNRFLFSEER